VSPQSSNLRFALTAAGCACAGFGVVWASLAVRGVLRGGDVPAGIERSEVVAMPDDPPAAAAAALADEPAVSRFAASPVEQTSFGTPSDDPAPPPPQRYASPGRFGGALPTAEPDFIDTTIPAMDAAGNDVTAYRSPHPIRELSGSEPADRAQADHDADLVADAAPTDILGEDDPAPYDALPEPAANREPPAPMDDAARFQSPEPLDDGRTDIPEDDRLPEDFGDVAAQPTDSRAFVPVPLPGGQGNPLRPPVGPPPAGSIASPPQQPFAGTQTADATPSAPAAPAVPIGPPVSPASTSSAGTPSGKTAGFADRTDPAFDDGAPIPAHAQPARSSSAPAGTGMPFAAAPPIGPPPGALGGAPFPGAPAQGGSAGGVGSRPDQLPPTPTGQGRPGAIQLEGVQTPQLAVEKRGPREIQVGKTARFEILVRNVGSAVANDVVLRDAVPFGTALVATTPPASPNHAPGGHADASTPSGELVWQLGALPPGGQARVALDVMPLQEGDVGSVASVSFRADASVRARATRPALEIVAEPPPPVLVGLESRLTITISNPGSGVATGVVLEGLLPEGLTHRAGHELEFDVGSLPPGESRTIDLVLATTGPGVHALRLTARADGRIEVSETVKIAVTAPTLELAVQMPSRRYLQRPATCVLSMTNAGTAPALGVELVAQLPPGMKFIRANNAGYYEERTHRVLWNLEELPAAETGQVEVVVMPIALGPQKIVAAARTTAGLSDQIGHTVEVEGLAALAFEVADSEDPIEVGGVSEYVIRVANQGTKPASGVRVAATLLGDMEPVDARGPSPHRVDNLTISFEPLAKLAPSEEATYRIRVRGRREGDQRVQVQLTSDEQPAPITKEEITRVYADR